MGDPISRRRSSMVQITRTLTPCNVADGRLNVQPIITHRITPDEIPDAYRGLQDARTTILGSSSTT